MAQILIGKLEEDLEAKLQPESPTALAQYGDRGP